MSSAYLGERKCAVHDAYHPSKERVVEALLWTPRIPPQGIKMAHTHQPLSSDGLWGGTRGEQRKIKVRVLRNRSPSRKREKGNIGV